MSKPIDALPTKDMPAASGGPSLTFGFGAILGPLAAGAVMQFFGSHMFWVMPGATCLFIPLFALYRMTQSPVMPPAKPRAISVCSPQHFKLPWRRQDGEQPQTAFARHFKRRTN